MTERAVSGASQAPIASVLVTRPAGTGDPLAVRLAAAGIAVHAVPAVVTRLVPPGGDLDRAAEALAVFDWVLVTSATGAEALGAALARAALDRRRGDAADDTTSGAGAAGAGTAGGGPRFGVVGPATARALAALGFRASATSVDGTGAGLVDAMAAVGPLAGARVLLPRARAATSDLPEALRAAGALVSEVVAYETVEAPAESRGPLRDALADPRLRAAVVASGSAVRGLVALAGAVDRAGTVEPGPRSLASVPFVSIGPLTSAEVRRLGLPLACQAPVPTVEGLVDAVLELLDVGALPAAERTIPDRPAPDSAAPGPTAPGPTAADPEAPHAAPTDPAPPAPAAAGSAPTDPAPTPNPEVFR